MGRWIAGHADAHVGESIASEAHQIRRMAKFGLVPVNGLFLREIAAQGQNIVHIIVTQLGEEGLNMFAGRADAGQMRHSFQSETLFQAGHDIQRGGLAGTSRPVGNGSEQRVEG